MNGRPRRTWAIALAVALLAALARQAIGAAVFLPRFASEDPREVVTAYFEAQRWGFDALSERALAPDEREMRHAPNYVTSLVPDALLAHDLEVSPPGAIPLHGEYEQERQFTVTYRSVWRNVIGEPPGPRHWFVYVGRDEGRPWLVLGQGTGP